MPRIRQRVKFTARAYPIARWRWRRAYPSPPSSVPRTSGPAKPLTGQNGGFQVSVDSDASFTLSLTAGETKKDFAVQPGWQEFRI
jgi:hypothetical protein